METPSFSHLVASHLIWHLAFYMLDLVSPSIVRSMVRVTEYFLSEDAATEACFAVPLGWYS